MDKLIILPGKTDQGIFTYVIDAEKSFLEKTASAYHPTIGSYIHAAKPINGKTQVLLTALGAGEVWGPNANGDFFPEEALAHEGEDYGYKTFEYYAKLFKHHMNKPAQGHQVYGDVALSVYNPLYHRVELIVMIDNAAAPDLVDRVNSGDYFDFSMGCKVPYDVCRICGNKAPTRKQYCDHLKYYLGRIPPGSDKVAYAINTMPKFFDISVVLIGADRIAKMHRKVASAHSRLYGVSSALLAEKAAEAKKQADISKEVPASGDTPPASVSAVRDLADAITEVKAHEPALPTEMLNRLGSLPISSVMSTLAMLGILPKPQEFQRIVLVGAGQRSAADFLDQRGLCFDPLDGDSTPEMEGRLGLDASRFSPDVMRLLAPFMADRSYVAPHLGPRLVIMLSKQASEAPLPTFLKLGDDARSKERKPVGVLPMLALAAGLYAAFAKKSTPAAISGIGKLIAAHPALAAALGFTLYSAFDHMNKPGQKGNFVPGEAYTNPDTVDVFKRIEDQKAKPYIKLAGAGAAARRLFIGIPAAYMASGVLQKHREQNPYDGEGRMKSFIRRNPDVVSGALIADAMLALHGRGSHGIFRGKGSSFAKSAELAGDITGDHSIKTASAVDFLAGAALPTLALGTANLPGRIVGGLFDQAAFEVAKKLLDKHHKDQTG